MLHLLVVAEAAAGGEKAAAVRAQKHADRALPLPPKRNQATNETKRNKTKQNETKRNKTKRNETK
jgi:hypothetical protein